MAKIRVSLIPLFVCCILCSFYFIPYVIADNETNDSFDNPETFDSDMVTGSVLHESNGGDSDFYLISVPSKKDIVVTLRKTDYGSESICMIGYDSNRDEMSMGDIWMFVYEIHETGTGSWYNSEDFSQDIYLFIGGDGSYMVTIKFTDETINAQEAREASNRLFYLVTFGFICGGILIFILFIGFIVMTIRLATRKVKI